MSLYVDGEFKRDFVDTCRFADKLVSIVCRQRVHKVAMYTAVKTVLAAHVFTLKGRTDEAQTILDAAYRRVSDIFNSPNEIWDIVMRISITLNAFATAEVRSVADDITIAKMSRQCFLAKLTSLWISSEIILIEHIRKLRPEMSSSADMIIKAIDRRYFVEVTIWAFLIIPASFNALYLGVWTEPHSLWLRILAVFPCVSWFVSINMLGQSVCGFWGILFGNVASIIGVVWFCGLCAELGEIDEKIADIKGRLNLSIQAQQIQIPDIDDEVPDTSAHVTEDCGVTDTVASKLVKRSSTDTAYPPVSRTDDGIKDTLVPRVKKHSVTRVPLTAVKGNWPF